MKVWELINWLQEFADQDAIVEVLHCAKGKGYDDQGGNTYSVEFDPNIHVEYIDFRENPFSKGKPWGNSRTILFGLKD